MNFVICGTIDGEYTFPNDMFSNFCYESWGNAWCLIEGIKAKYIPAQEFINNPSRLKEVDILMAELGHKELHKLANKHEIFNIATESGAGFDIDKLGNIEEKLEFFERLNKCSLVLATTHGGKEYLKMFTNTPVLDIPLPMDLSRFYPRNIPKFDDFTLCIGEIIESCYDDRPLQIVSLAIARSLEINVVSTIGIQNRNFGESELNRLGLNSSLFSHQGFYEMSNNYLAQSHVSMMLGQRSTFGRFIYISWAVGVPCIATRYQCQEQICPRLTVSYEQIDKIKYLLSVLRDDKDFYASCRREGITNIRNLLDHKKIAVRIINEILPLFWRTI